MADPFGAFASDGFNNLIGGIESLIGGGATKGSSTTNANSSTVATSVGTDIVTGEDREFLEISDDAVNKIVDDILSGPDGLAAIFAGEQNSGIFNSSVAAQAAGDLVAQITGEIAKLRAQKVNTTDRKQERDQTDTQDTDQFSKTESKQKTEGILDQLF